MFTVSWWEQQSGSYILITWLSLWFILSILPLVQTISWKVTKEIKSITISAMCCFSISLLLRIIYLSLKCQRYELNEYILASFGSAPRLTWALGEALIHLLFIKRLVYAFRNTIYESNKYVYNILYVSIFMFMICNIVLLLLHLLYHWSDIFAKTQYTMYRFIVTVVY
eukprot:440204_1